MLPGSITRLWRMLFGSVPDYHVECFTGEDMQFYWRIRHVNGNTLATSEGYRTKFARTDTATNFASKTDLPILFV